MHIQPLLLTTLAGRTEIYPGFECRAVGSQPVDRAVGDRSAGRADTAEGRQPQSGQGDTVEISREAEIRLLGQLDKEQQRQVQRLKADDRRVRAHEQAQVIRAAALAPANPSAQDRSVAAAAAKMEAKARQELREKQQAGALFDAIV